MSYVDQGPYGARIYRHPITADGDWEERWPNGFFTERRREVLG